MPVLNRVREERMAKQMTQDELAKEVGCTRLTITYLETYRKQPSGEMMLKIAKALEIPVERLFEVVDESAMQKVVRVAGATAKALPQQAVIAFILFIVIMRGGALAFESIDPNMAWTLRGIATWAASPGRVFEESQALGIPLWKLGDSDTVDSAVPDKPSVPECQQWIQHYAYLARPNDEDGLTQMVRERTADCFDVLDASDEAVKLRERMIDNEMMNDLPLQVNLSNPRFTHAVMLYFNVERAYKLGDREAAAKLLQQAAEEDSVALFLVGRKRLGSLEFRGEHKPAYKTWVDPSDVLPATEVDALSRTAFALGLFLTRPWSLQETYSPNAVVRVSVKRTKAQSIAEARRQLRIALREWPGLSQAINGIRDPRKSSRYYFSLKDEFAVLLGR